MTLPFGIPSPTEILVGVAILGIVSTSSFLEGHHIATQANQASMLKATQVAEAKYQAQVVSYNAIAAQLEEAKNVHHVLTKTITKSVDRIINRPVYLTQCFDADGLLSANAALTGKPTPSSKPDAALPSSNPSN